MPELPEVEVCRRGLQPELEGRRILSAEVRYPRLREVIPEGLAERLSGRRILAIQRRGKYLLFDCRGEPGGGWLILHLGMSGNLRFVSPQELPGKHDHFDLRAEGTLLRFADPRRFGVIAWQDGDDPMRHPLLAVLGMEPLGDGFDGKWLFEMTRKRSGPIKPVLMDGHLLVGVGNIYASESLFRAGISPLRAANRIGRERCDLLAACIRQTLSDAIAAGGSSIRDYVHSDGGAGCFQVECAVYDRAGAPCRRCSGSIRQIRQAGRSTFYCPGCQH